MKPGAWYSVGAFLLAFAGTIGFGVPIEAIADFRFWPLAAGVLLVLGCVAIGVGAVLSITRSARAESQELRTEVKELRGEVTQARASYNSLKAKEEELTRIELEIGDLQHPHTIASISLGITDRIHKTSTLEARAERLRAEIRNLGSE